MITIIHSLFDESLTRSWTVTWSIASRKRLPRKNKPRKVRTALWLKADFRGRLRFAEERLVCLFFNPSIWASEEPTADQNGVQAQGMQPSEEQKRSTIRRKKRKEELQSVYSYSHGVATHQRIAWFCIPQVFMLVRAGWCERRKSWWDESALTKHEARALNVGKLDGDRAPPAAQRKFDRGNKWTC